MLIYRILLAKYTKRLYCSGLQARWNRGGEFVLYGAESKELACLENVVHRKGTELNQPFSVLTIRVPEGSVTIVDSASLPDGWQRRSAYPICQAIGSEWYERGEHLLLKVPNAIIAGASGYVVNSRHPAWPEVEIVADEPFAFDPRIKDPDPENNPAL
jgi:RES domain-containing protein